MLLEHLIIGNTIEAQAYCLLNNDAKLLCVEENNIFPFERLHHKYLGTSNKHDLYCKLLFMNSMLGNIIYSEVPTKISVSSDTCSVVFSTEKEEIIFNKCSIFDTLNLSLLDFEQAHRQETVIVIDLFEARNIKKEYDFSPLRTGDDFISTVWPHNSGRIAGSKYVTEFYTESRIPFSNIYDFDVSETMAKFKLCDHLDNSRFLGTLSHLDDNEDRVYSKITLDHADRHVHQPRVLYKDTPKVKFNKETLQEIFLEKKERKFKD